jgi:hypothetical protein
VLGCSGKGTGTGETGVATEAATTGVATGAGVTGDESSGAPTTGSLLCGPGLGAAPADIVSAWRRAGKQGDIEVVLSVAAPACGELPNIPCPDGDRELRGYVLTLRPEAQVPGVYSLLLNGDPSPAMLGMSTIGDDGDNGCIPGDVYFDSGEVEVFQVDAGCMSLEIRGVATLANVGYPFDPNGFVGAEGCL